MLHPIKGVSDLNHFLEHEATRKHIFDHGFMFEDLKKELPKLKSQKVTTEEYDLDCAKDRKNQKSSKEQWFMMLHIEEVLSSGELKALQVNTGGKQPLPLCEECTKHKLIAPRMGGSTNFMEKRAQEKTTKAAHYEKAMLTGIRRQTGKK
eukprot:4788015-Ditylum_brightwellii.AAC.1